MGGAEQQFCLRWNNHQSTLVSVFEALLESETLVDVTLAAEGRFLKAHKVVLCACSPFFQELLSSHLEKYPIIVLKDVTFQELKALIDYMYRGEVNVSQEQLAALIKTAESLKIKGLADGGSDKHKKQPSPVATSSPVPPPPPPPPQQQQQQQPPSAPPAEHRNSPVNNVREGSASPVSRKRRKRSRRRSGDSVEGSVESSLSEPPAGEIMDAEKERVIRALGLVPPSALLEPKAEEIEEEEEESVDLMLDEEHTSEGKDSERPGPSHEGLQSSGAGFPPWHVTPERGGGSQSGEDLSISVAGGDSGGSAGMENRGSTTTTPAAVDLYSKILSVWGPATLVARRASDGGSSTTASSANVNPSTATASGEKGVYACPRCGNSYARPHSLNRHLRFECGVEPQFECPICHKKSKHKHNLMLHMRTHLK